MVGPIIRGISKAVQQRRAAAGLKPLREKTAAEMEKEAAEKATKMEAFNKRQQAEKARQKTEDEALKAELKKYPEDVPKGEKTFGKSDPLREAEQMRRPQQSSFFDEFGEGASGGDINPLNFKKGGKVKTKMSSASKRADGIAQRGKTRGRFV